MKAAEHLCYASMTSLGGGGWIQTNGLRVVEPVVEQCVFNAPAPDAYLEALFALSDCCPGTRPKSRRGDKRCGATGLW
jgi:hypothetical protein